MKFARTTETPILRSVNGKIEHHHDMLAIEEPLEMYLDTEGQPETQEPFAITMRTPGHDRDLVVGLLFCEGIVTSYDQIVHIEETLTNSIHAGVQRAIRVKLQKEASYNPSLIKRHIVTTSSCGFCGRLSMPQPPFVKKPERRVDLQPGVLHKLPGLLRQGQVLFKHTGGIHAAALFNRKGLLIYLYEDVGRHNAMDKLVGHALQQNQLPFANHILCFSGRVSFELMQKAIMTQVGVVASIGAPSSLAVELARQYGIALVGFLKPDRFNVYHYISKSGND